MPVLTETLVNDKIHFLGEHRDFRNQANLEEFLNGETSISLSWTHLKEGEQLDIHTHPIKSMIIICSGHGILLGDTETGLTEGDVVIVPPYTKHGFRGAGVHGFHALSIQFDDKSFYARGLSPKVAFSESRDLNKQFFLDYNQKRINHHMELPIFEMIKDGTFHNTSKMERLLSFLKTWSSFFQKIVMLRVITTSSNIFEKFAKQHLIEEFGHDTLLKDPPINDPILKAIATWFIHQMMCRSDLEKHIIVHCVLENGAHCFHNLAEQYLKNSDGGYFNVHVEHDSAHSNMGMEHIIENFSTERKKILNTLDEAWDMLDLLFMRAHELVNGNP